MVQFKDFLFGETLIHFFLVTPSDAQTDTNSFCPTAVMLSWLVGYYSSWEGKRRRRRRRQRQGTLEGGGEAGGAEGED